jgi:hypothetical protein
VGNPGGGTGTGPGGAGAELVQDWKQAPGGVAAPAGYGRYLSL